MRGSDQPDLKDRVEYAGLSTVLAAFRALPSRWGRSSGGRLGSFVARCVPIRRDVALDNLAYAFPESTEAERTRIYRSMLENLGIVLAEFARLHRDPDAVRGLVAMDHPEHIASLGQEGAGGIVLTAHFGNWEALGAAGSAHAKITMLGARQRNPLVENLFSEYRARLGVDAVSVRGGLRPIVRALRRGQVVASLADQDGGPDGFFVDFLGRKASVQPGLFRLAARMGLGIVTGFSFREGDHWRAEIQAPIRPGRAEGDEEVEGEARSLAQRYTRRVEEAVRRRPDHWFWVHRRWKTRPAGEAQTDPPRSR